MKQENIRFRFANEKDCRLILKFIRSLAKYEKLEKEVVATEAILREWLFEKKKAEVLFVMDGDTEVGYALFFHNFSTFLGRAGIYLEDLYVRPSYRGRGYGKALLREVAHGVVLPGLESAEHRFLQVARRGVDGRMDGLPRRRGCAQKAGRDQRLISNTSGTSNTSGEYYVRQIFLDG